PSSLTPSQLSSYLSHLRLPKSLLSAPRDIYLLRLLHTLHLASLPYENLALHYSPTHDNSILPSDLYTKCISPSPSSSSPSRGRGGYCLELSVLYLNLLRAVGFNAYPSMARIRLRRGPVPEGRFVGYVHLTIIVTLADGTKWSSDVGFGGDGATAPLLLSEDARPVPNLGAQEVRLVRRTTQGVMLGKGLEGEKAWFYQYRNGEEGRWNTYYAFSGEPADEARELDEVNHWTSTAEGSFQRGTVLVVKFILTADGLIAGKIMLADGVVKRNLGGKTEVLRVCRTEEERVLALKEFFGIELTDEQRDGIKGFATELKAD
ncbi:cysteine proteinase, partial [Myriangium duriaei CBS 260.36]